MRRSARLILGSLIALPLAPVAAQRPSRSVLTTQIDSMFAAALAAPAAGFQVAVVQGQDTLMMKGYGYANLELRVPVSNETVFRIGSTTKQFTAAATMQLVERGTLRLTDSVGQLLPQVPAHWRRITVHQLLNHTSGIPSYSDLGARVRSMFVLGAPRDSVVAMLRNDSLLFTPGTGFSYTNTGYYLLGMIIEKVTGKPYAAYIDDTLARTAGLAQTRYCGTRPTITNRASGYDLSAKQLSNAAYVDIDFPYAAGAMCSTARELVQWSAALSSGRVVSAASYSAMTTPVKLSSPRPMTYGYGFFVDSIGPYRMLEHGGNIPGFASSLMYVPTEGLRIAVITNTTQLNAAQLAFEIAHMVLGVRPPTFAQRDEPLDDQARAALLGRYLLTQGDGSKREVAIIARDGGIAIEGLAPQPAPLLRQSGNVFAVRGQSVRLYFDRAGTQVTGFILERGVRPLPARRIP